MTDWLPGYAVAFVPIGIIGAIRWFAWGIRKFIAFFYKPVPPAGTAGPVSIVTPVYNENPEAFRRALHSWITEKPTEIIAVIDASDRACIQVFSQEAMTAKVDLRLIVTKVPGKRPALVKGIKAAKSEIVALVDSDTVWEQGLLPNVTAPFADPRVGGVGTRQNVANAHSFWQRMADVALDLRYHDEMRFLGRIGGQVTCLSGRTAVYRREILLPLFPEFLNERFLGEQCNSGDDKRFTYLIQQNGYRSAYQHTARVYTFAPKDFSSFLKQRVRWARNSWRADLRALSQSWTWHHPGFVLFLIDRTISPFTALFSPIFMAYVLIQGDWLFAGILGLWWLVSRTIKLLPHILNRPVDIFLAPLYVPITFLLAIIKIHALVTIGWQGWLTRTASRINYRQIAATMVSLLASVSVVIMMASLVFLISRATASAFTPSSPTFNISEGSLESLDGLAAWRNDISEPTFSLSNPEIESSAYEAKAGEDLPAIARRNYGNPFLGGVVENANWAALQDGLHPGLQLKIPALEIKTLSRPAGTRASVVYNQETGQIVVSGLNSVATLSQVAQAVPKGLLIETGPKEWYLAAPLTVADGATLALIGGPQGDASWLKLRSEQSGFAFLDTLGGSLYLESTKVTSWDPQSDSFDTEIADGRAYVLAKNNSSKIAEVRMDILGSELAFLGYDGPEAYGVSWRVSSDPPAKRTTGVVLGTSFHNNYFGAYTYGAKDMFWVGNSFLDNVVYGLDPHDDSNGFTVLFNRLTGNGKHGLIFSKRCTGNLIAYNISAQNGGHGIMLDQSSNDNIVAYNEVSDNADGIAIFASSRNTVLGNYAFENRSSGIRFNSESSTSPANNNLIIQNRIEWNQTHGIYLYGLADKNVIQQNSISIQGGNGIYVRSKGNWIGGTDRGNIIRFMNRGIVVDGPEATDNVLSGNEITRAKASAISISDASRISVQGNRVIENLDRGIDISAASMIELTNNLLERKTKGITLSNCKTCLLEANTLGDLKLQEASQVIIKGSVPGSIRFVDRESTVSIFQPDGLLLVSSSRLHAFVSGIGAIMQITPVSPNSVLKARLTSISVKSANPLIARVADRSTPTWTVAGPTGFEQTVHGLENGRLFEVTVDGQRLGSFFSDSQGALSFQYNGDTSEPRTFELYPR